MKDGRPRSLLWVARNGMIFPQIAYDDPRIGGASSTVIAERKLRPDEFDLSLDQLAARYPAPVQEPASC